MVKMGAGSLSATGGFLDSVRQACYCEQPLVFGPFCGFFFRPITPVIVVVSSVGGNSWQIKTVTSLYSLGEIRG